MNYLVNFFLIDWIEKKTDFQIKLKLIQTDLFDWRSNC